MFVKQGERVGAISEHEVVDDYMPSLYKKNCLAFWIALRELGLTIPGNHASNISFSAWRCGGGVGGLGQFALCKERCPKAIVSHVLTYDNMEVF